MKNLLESPSIYRLWQSPFSKQKLIPLRKYKDSIKGHSILDVGCGPAMNIDFFSGCSRYLGVDLSQEYVDFGNQHFPGCFIRGNATSLSHTIQDKFDFVLSNSLLHHLTEEEVVLSFREMSRLVAPSGTVFIIDLTTDYSSTVTKFLTECDRGRHPRTADRLKQLALENFEIIDSIKFNLTFGGVKCWDKIFLALNKKQDEQ